MTPKGTTAARKTSPNLTNCFQGCLENLDALLYYPMWIPDPGRGALSNNILASRPNHPYWAMLTQSLRAWDYHYLFPYVTISYASGQWLCTDIWERYHALLPPHGDGTGLDHRAHRLVMDDRDQGTGEWIYFSQERGGTWKNWDNRMFLWIGDHLLLFFLGLAALLGGLGWMALRHMPRRIGYSRLL